MTRLLISEESQRRLHEDDPGWTLKAALRLVATFFAFLAMILFSVAVRMTTHWEDVWDDGYGNDWTDAMPLAPVVLALLFNPITLFLLLRHRRGRSYHPAWNIGGDFLIWALAVPSIVFSVGDGWFWWWQPVRLDFDGIIPCDEFNFWSEVCQPDIYTMGKIEIAANVFLALILIIHFVLFVMDCVATHKWRMDAKRAETERRNIELQYHRSPEQHLAHQPPAYSSAGDDKSAPWAVGGSPASSSSPSSPISPTNGGLAKRYG